MKPHQVPQILGLQGLGLCLTVQLRVRFISSSYEAVKGLR